MITENELQKIEASLAAGERPAVCEGQWLVGMIRELQHDTRLLEAEIERLRNHFDERLDAIRKNL